MAKKMKKFGAFLLVFAMSVIMLSTSAFASETAVCKIVETGVEYETLTEAVTAANELEGANTIVMLKDIDFDADAALSITGELTITGGKTISRGDYTKGFFRVPSGSSLTLDNIVLDGGNNWTFLEEEFRADAVDGNRIGNVNVSYVQHEEGAVIASGDLISVGGKVVLDNGTTIQNHAGCRLFYVGAGAELVTNDVTITHNTRGGSAVVADVDGSWIINGTVISDNHCEAGNGVVAYMRGTCVMNGGKIYGNTGEDCNGSVMMLYTSNASFTMNDGRIYDNGATYGSNNGWNPAFYVYGNGSKFTMNGGSIEGNYSDSIPGIANNGSNALITLNGGKILNTSIGRGFTAKDVYTYAPVVIEQGKVVDSGTNRFYNNVTNAGTLNGDSWFYSNEMTYSGGGTFNGNVTVQSGAETTMADGSWINGMVTVKAVGNDSTLTVKPEATIDGIQVRVLNSVESGDYTNATEATAAQAAAYVEEAGANVISPVLYYHRLTPAQQNSIVVTYDYNGGLDAQGWSGCQITSAEAFAPTAPVPTMEGFVFDGWVYAEDNNPESLSMSGIGAYAGEEIAESVRLIAQWKTPEEIEDIPDEDVPLASTPVEEEEDDLSEIPDEDVPMADVPKTGDLILPFLGMAIASGAATIFAGKTDKKKEDEE